MPRRRLTRLAPVNDVFDGRTLRGEPLRCPVDGARLVQVERSDILIDACPECRGVWLDRGELDDDDFFSEMEGKRRPEQRQRAPEPEPRYDEPQRKKKKRRSLLEELLDFD